jgi:hypothetical protein
VGVCSGRVVPPGMGRPVKVVLLNSKIWRETDGASECRRRMSSSYSFVWSQYARGRRLTYNTASHSSGASARSLQPCKLQRVASTCIPSAWKCGITLFGASALVLAPVVMSTVEVFVVYTITQAGQDIIPLVASRRHSPSWSHKGLVAYAK